ncbi:MAG: response regulator transcription factor [Planctomycetaceae bacterium]|nr:response regulator transcription factor [Planctomycetaceae bacterium]
MTEEMTSTVYVVDDDAASRRLIASLLEAIFPYVQAFESAAEFLDAYENGRPGCLVLDVAMPGMSGLELQRTLVDRGIQLPIVFLTGHANVQMAVGAMQAGAVNFLEKPFREQELWESVRHALDLDRKRRKERVGRTDGEQRVSKLAPGEREVLALILEGMFNKEIAAQLNLSIRTVEDRRARLMRKLEVNSVVELVQLTMPLIDMIRSTQEAPAASAC